MGDEELLEESLDCIYEIAGDYVSNRDDKYPSHKAEIDEVNRIIKLLEKRLDRNNHAQ